MDNLFWVAPYLPLVLTIIFGISQLLLQVFLPSRLRRWLTHSALLEMALLSLVTIVAYISRTAIVDLPPQLKNTALVAFQFLDGFALFFYLLLIAASFVTILSASLYLERENLASGEFYALIFFALAGMMVLSSAHDLMTLFIGLEIVSMSVYILVGYRRDDLKANEGAFKYFLLGSLASAILLYGIALTYGVVGSLDLLVIQKHFMSRPFGPLASMGLLLILGGLAFKVAAVPFHSWAPDAYEGAPMPVTGFMATAVKAAAFALLLKVLGEGFIGLRAYWVEVVSLLAALTMIAGNVLAFVQQNFKRMLAYSSIVHTGYLLLGLSALSTQPDDNHIKVAILYYLFVYVMSSLGVFMALTHLSSRGEKIQAIEDYSGLAHEYPFTAAALALFMFSFMGVPPLGGFFAKYYLFTASMQQHQTLLVAFAIFNSVLSIAYYLRVVVVMYMQPVKDIWGTAQSRPASVSLVLALTSLITFWSGFGPFNLLGLIPGLTPLIEWLSLVVT